MGAYILPLRESSFPPLPSSVNQEAGGLHFDNVAYLVTATLCIFIFVLFYALFIKFVWKTDLTPLKDFDVTKLSMDASDTKLNSKQKVLLGFMIFGIVFLLAGMVLPKGSAVYAMYNKIGSTWVWVVLYAILCFMRDKEGKPYIDGIKLLQSKTMWESSPWPDAFYHLRRAIH